MGSLTNRSPDSRIVFFSSRSASFSHGDDVLEVEREDNNNEEEEEEERVGEDGDGEDDDDDDESVEEEAWAGILE